MSNLLLSSTCRLYFILCGKQSQKIMAVKSPDTAMICSSILPNLRLGEASLANYRDFIQDQEEHKGDICNCLTELRVEIDKFVRGDKNDKKS